MDLFVVPTIGFDLLYVLRHRPAGPPRLVWINVTRKSNRGMDRAPDH